jgi:hypothetical protein
MFSAKHSVSTFPPTLLLQTTPAVLKALTSSGFLLR